MLDESSLASTKQMHDFVTRLQPNDRVLLVGDTRQHEAVEAGRPFAQLQEAGMKTVKLDEIVRQKDPELKKVVEDLSQGRVGEAIGGLERQGRVHEVKNQADRIEAIAREYARSPENTLVVSPDNCSRADINAKIHAVTSHSSQSLTADRVLINIDTELAANDLLNNRMAYVSVSRGAHDTQIFTNGRQQLPRALSRDVSHQSAHLPEVGQEQSTRPAAPEHKPAAENKPETPVEKIYTWAEHERHWTPLNKALTKSEAGQFGWVAENGTLQSYQHVETRRHIHIDGPSGQFFRHDKAPIAAKEALDFALPAGTVHSLRRIGSQS